MGMVKGRGCGVGWGGVVYVWDSVDPKLCDVGVWTSAPTPAGVQGGGVLTSGSPWPGAGREREVFLRSRRGCGLWAARAPGPEGGARLPGAARAEPRAGAGPRQLPGQFGSALAGEGEEGGDALPAHGQRSRRRGGGKARVSDAGVRQLRSQLLFLGSGTQRQTGSVGGSSRGSLGMLLGKEPPPLPSLPLCKSSASALRCLRRGAPRANRGRRYLCSIRRDLGAGGTGPLRTPFCCCTRNFHFISSGTVRLQ